ncbi:MAG TPA: hypothetical protein VHM20_02335, partial [Gammaproteobacteria bacterium]|nr:hypothetical protein [Gammaproteobacteria bacterium]
MKINYKQFLTIFNKPLAEQKSLVVDVSDILKDVNINDYLDIVFVSLVEENIVLEQAVNYPLRMVIDTFKNNNNNFKNINIDFSNFKITKQAVSDLFDLLNHWPDHIRLINFCDFDKDGFKAFTQALKTAKNLPAINFEYPGTSGIPVSEQNEFISALSVCASKKIMFYFKHSTISREDFVVFSEALATADLSAKDYVILWFPKPKLRLGNFRFQQIKKEEL